MKRGFTRAEAQEYMGIKSRSNFYRVVQSVPALTPKRVGPMRIWTKEQLDAAIDNAPDGWSDSGGGREKKSA